MSHELLVQMAYWFLYWLHITDDIQECRQLYKILTTKQRVSHVILNNQVYKCKPTQDVDAFRRFLG